MANNLEGKTNIIITIKEDIKDDVQILESKESQWLAFSREFVILVLLCVSFLAVLDTSVENQRNIKEHIQLTFNCDIEMNDNDGGLHRLKDMEGRVTLYLNLIQGVRLATTIAICLIVFYPIVVLMNGSIATFKPFKKLNVMLIHCAPQNFHYHYPFVSSSIFLFIVVVALALSPKYPNKYNL